MSTRSNRVTLAMIAMGFWAAAAGAGELMPVSQQNALVRKYCAVCHTDAAKNGGLSLEHFDAAHAAPSLTAIMLSKLTSGVTLQTALDVSAKPDAAALVDQKMKAGAMGAAGIPIPPKATIDALIHAFAVESAGATEWKMEHAPTLTASILREMPSATNAREAEFYRVIVSCNPATREGEIQLAWSPVPRSGSLSASVDGVTAVPYRVEGSESMGNGNGVILHASAALMLSGLPLPKESLKIRDLFPGETVEFPFATLPKDARRELGACFGGAR